jgi:hypothetical protein
VIDSQPLTDCIGVRALAIGLRDRAVMALFLTHSAVRVENIVAMQVRDYYLLGDRRWIRLMADGVERLEPVDGRLETYIDEYLAVVRIEDDPSSPLFRHLLRDGKVTPRPLWPAFVRRIIRKRVRQQEAARMGPRARGLPAPLQPRAEKSPSSEVSENFTKRPLNAGRRNRKMP